MQPLWRGRPQNDAMYKGRCVAFAVEMAIQRNMRQVCSVCGGKYAPTSLPSVPANVTRVAATVTGVSAEKSRTPSSAMHRQFFQRAYKTAKIFSQKRRHNKTFEHP